MTTSESMIYGMLSSINANLIAMRRILESIKKDGIYVKPESSNVPS